MGIFLDILHSLPFLRLLLIELEYDSIFEVDQRNFSKRFCLGIYFFNVLNNRHTAKNNFLGKKKFLN